jgi:transposase
MKQYYVGLDVHSKQSTFVIQDAKGNIVASGEVPTTPAGFTSLQTEHQLPPGTPVALESGTIALFVARQLSGIGLKPLVVDATEVRQKAHRPRQKSDRRDARELCEGLRRGIYRCLVHIPPPAVAAVRETLSRRRHFVRIQSAEMNAAKRLLRAAGLGQQSHNLRTDSGWTKLLAALSTSPDLKVYVAQHYALWRCAREQSLALEKLLAEQQQPFRAELERLQTIPGVGPIVAATTVAVFSDVRRFPSAKHAASYAGLVPSTYQSGESDRHGRITKQGSGELRAMLCEAAQHAAHTNHPLNPYFSSLRAKRGYQHAVIAVAHRLCRVMFAMLRQQTVFDLSKLGVEEGPFVRTTHRLYRRKVGVVSTR